MSLINPVILYGAVLAIVPIVLHLLLRSKPKKLVFPALRLIDARRRQNVRRLRLKHLWLLVLRIALLLLLVLALARPSLPAANYSLTPREWGTVAAIAAVVGGAYFAMLRNWKRQGLPRHTLVYRRAFLRGGAGLAAAVLLALFVAWPYQRRIAAEISSPLPQVAEQLPVAAVFLFDTSLSMEYQHESKTRLEVAQTIAVEHLNRLPSRSRIAVADTSSGNPILFQADLASAQSRIEGLRTSAVSQPLDDRLLAAFDLQQQDRSRTLQSQRAEAGGRDAYVREIYVFTDLACTGWRTGDSPALKEALDRNKWVSLYLIDVGVPSPVNIGLRRLRLSDESLPRGGKLYVETHVTAIGVGDKSGGREDPSGGALPASRSGKPAA
ncbi:MAG: hypothetical protein GXP27_20470, partial [Planctomycetes bacterium]|nr:hypothetical protein [Planctomycetota bacterium]